MGIDREALARIVKAALEEDIGAGDVTTESVIDPEAIATGEVFARARGIVCGVPIEEEVFRSLDPAAEIRADLVDGDAVESGGRIVAVRGRARAILTGERTALNFLGRLSGIATMTQRYVEAVKGTGVAIYDTRKTTPLWRSLEKHAVRCGGGENHRMGLDDQALLKENHLAFLEGSEASWRKAIAAARERTSIVVVEATGREEALMAARAGADGVLLDNLSPDTLPEVIAAVRAVPGRGPFVEVSGGVTLETVARIAAAGPDRISVGALTHSAPSLDLSMRVTPASP